MPADNTPGVESPTDFERAFTDAAAAASAAPASAPTDSSPPAAAPESPSSGAAAAAPPAAPAPSPFLGVAQELGLPADGLSDEQLAHQIRDYVTRSKPYVQYGQQLAPYADQIREYFAQQAQAAQSTPAPGTAGNGEDFSEERYFTDKWNAPKWDDSYTFAIQQGLVQRNAESGLYEAAPGFESMVIEILPGLNRAIGWTAQQWQGITRGNPYRQFYDVLSEPLRHQWRSDIERMVAEQLTRLTAEQQVNTFEEQNASWLYATDPQTQQRVLTPKGQQFYDEINLLSRAGVTDHQQLITLALRQIQLQAAPAPAPAAGLSVATPSAPPPVPAPPISPPAASAQQQASFVQNALQRAAHTPQASGYTQPAPDHPVQYNETDLNNLFVQEFRKQQATGS